MFGVGMGHIPPQVSGPVDIRVAVVVLLQLHSLHLHLVLFVLGDIFILTVLLCVLQCVEFYQILYKIEEKIRRK